MSKDFRIEVVDLPDYENLVSEIFYEEVQWVEISQEKGDLLIQFYAHPFKKYWEFKMDEALEALLKAKKRLIEIG